MPTCWRTAFWRAYEFSSVYTVYQGLNISWWKNSRLTYILSLRSRLSTRYKLDGQRIHSACLWRRNTVQKLTRRFGQNEKVSPAVRTRQISMWFVIVVPRRCTWFQLMVRWGARNKKSGVVRVGIKFGKDMKIGEEKGQFCTTGWITEIERSSVFRRVW